MIADVESLAHFIPANEAQEILSANVIKDDHFTAQKAITLAIYN